MKSSVGLKYVALIRLTSIANLRIESNQDHARVEKSEIDEFQLGEKITLQEEKHSTDINHYVGKEYHLQHLAHYEFLSHNYKDELMVDLVPLHMPDCSLVQVMCKVRCMPVPNIPGPQTRRGDFCAGPLKKAGDKKKEPRWRTKLRRNFVRNFLLYFYLLHLMISPNWRLFLQPGLSPDRPNSRIQIQNSARQRFHSLVHSQRQKL